MFGCLLLTWAPLSSEACACTWPRWNNENNKTVNVMAKIKNNAE
jgi:hypothetical protein